MRGYIKKLVNQFFIFTGRFVVLLPIGMILLCVISNVISPFINNSNKPKKFALLKKAQLNPAHTNFINTFTNIFYSLPVNKDKAQPIIMFQTNQTNDPALYTSDKIYLFHNSIAALDKEIQAGIISHEISHELLGHHKNVNELADVVGLITETSLPISDDKVKTEMAEFYLSTVRNSFDKKQELEADELALRVLKVARYENPKGVMKKTFDYINKNIHDSYFKNHPSPANRVELMAQSSILKPYLIKDAFTHVKNGSIGKLSTYQNEDINLEDLKDEYGRTLLHIAVLNKQLEVIHFLLKIGLNINAIDNEDYTCLDSVASFTAGYEVDYHFDNRSIEFKKNNSQAEFQNIISTLKSAGAKHNSIHAAASLGDVKSLDKLISAGADINSFTSTELITGKIEMTAMHWAALKSQTETVKYLIKNKASINHHSEHGFTPLDISQIAKNDENQTLIKNNNGISGAADSLIVAAFFGNENEVKKHINNGVDINISDTSKTSPLHHSSLTAKLQIANFLISKGANVNAKDIAERTPLHLAANHEIAKLLISNGAEISPKDGFGLTPLHNAAQYGDKELINTLINEGAKVNLSASVFGTPLDMADGDQDIVNFLGLNGALNSALMDKLLDAAEKGEFSVIKKQVSKGADLNFENALGQTLLHFAVSGDDNNTQLLDFLILNDINLDIDDEGLGNPILFSLIEDNKTDICTKLINNGIDVNRRDEIWSSSALHTAASSGNTVIVKLLIDKAADINAIDLFGSTPLHNAASGDNVVIVKLLIDKGGDINVIDRLKQTPLDNAAENIQISNILKKHGGKKGVELSNSKPSNAEINE